MKSQYNQNFKKMKVYEIIKMNQKINLEKSIAFKIIDLCNASNPHLNTCEDCPCFNTERYPCYNANIGSTKSVLANNVWFYY